jgi:hypothetical protein
LTQAAQTDTISGVHNRRSAVRGGSWRDLPGDAAAFERFGYQPFEKILNVGFCVVCEDYQLAEVAGQ